jgi:hypothetical protein
MKADYQISVGRSVLGEFREIRYRIDPGRCPQQNQVAGENTQSNGRIRRSFVFDAFPCQPQLGLKQDSFSLPKIFMTSTSDSDACVHFFSKFMLWEPLGHWKTIR